MADEVFDMATVVEKLGSGLPDFDRYEKVLVLEPEYCPRKKAWVPNWLWRLVAEEGK